MSAAATKPPPIANATDYALSRLRERKGVETAIVDRARWLASFLARFPAPQVLTIGDDGSPRAVLLSWLVGPWQGRGYTGVEVEVRTDGMLTCRTWNKAAEIGSEWTSAEPSRVHQVKASLAVLFQRFE